MYRLFRNCKLCRGNKQNLGRVRIRKKHLIQEKTVENNELAAGYKPYEMENIKIDENYFSPTSKSNKKPYTLILPPPNITGTLHLGHALTASIQDVLIKWYKMNGIDTMWVPGLDHAGIATQVVVEKKLWNEKGLTRHDLGRESFIKEVWKWKKEKQSTIVHQLRRLNISLNWEEETFTLDDKRSKAVVEAFIQLFDKGLIYRADHLVNWSCILQSAISDIEVEHLKIEKPVDLLVPGYDKPVKFGELTRFAYKIENSDDEIVVATTRPETMLGDVAVAVNPKDSRYNNVIGKYLRHPFRNEVIPIIADDFVDPEFGSGAVKITPAHDPTDFEAGKRHQLAPLQIIDEKGYLNEVCGDFKGLKRFDAREVIIKELANKQLLRGIDEHSMVVPICSRSRDIIEFLIRPQWFINSSEMAKRAVSDVKDGHLQIEPPNFEKIWFHWLENVRDWCISRQLWWGHQIPAYLCFKSDNKENNVWVAAESESSAKLKASKVLNCNVTEIDASQDEDVLDTWFSSALQPFSVFGWPEKADVLSRFYPISLMETGHDILFFWVARMVMLGTELMGDLPFNKILLHGIVCDVYGRKMSKSLGNVIDPEDIINGCSLEVLNSRLKQNFTSGLMSKEELNKALQGQQKMFPNGIPDCGSDALRFTLVSHNIKNYFINFSIDECHTNRLFCNKIWQATKFALIWHQKVSEIQEKAMFEQSNIDHDSFAPMDKWILSRLTYMLETVHNAFENYEFWLATSSLKNFLYFEFCDIYLESIKTDFNNQPEQSVSKNHCKTLITCLDISLRTLAPFMPVLSQHLHKHLPRIWGVGVDRSFPKLLNLRDKELEKNVEDINDIAVCIRRLKKMFNVTYKHNPEAYLLLKNDDLIQNFSETIKDLSKLHRLHILINTSQIPQVQGLISDSVGETKVFLLVPEELLKTLDVDERMLEKKKEKLFKELEKMRKIVNGEGYREKVSLSDQEIHFKKISSIEEKIARINFMQTLSKQMAL